MLQEYFAEIPRTSSFSYPISSQLLLLNSFSYSVFCSCSFLDSFFLLLCSLTTSFLFHFFFLLHLGCLVLLLGCTFPETPLQLPSHTHLVCPSPLLPSWKGHRSTHQRPAWRLLAPAPFCLPTITVAPAPAHRTIIQPVLAGGQAYSYYRLRTRITRKEGSPPPLLTRRIGQDPKIRQ